MENIMLSKELMENKEVLKAMENLNELGCSVLSVDLSKNQIEYLTASKTGKSNFGKLDYFVNFGWCPYCDSAIADEPFCDGCGDVSGSSIDKKYYDKGVTL